MFTRQETRQGRTFTFETNGYRFHVLHSISGRWTVYQMELEPHGKTFLDANALIAHYPVAYRTLRDIAREEMAL